MKFYKDLERFADSTVAIDSKGCRYTYWQLVEESARFSARLSKNRKNLVFILCANDIESMVAYIGTLRSGNTAALLAANTNPELLSNLIRLYQPDYIWRSDADDGKVVYEYKSYRLIHSDVERNITINPDLALLLSTSGSTGSPKMVRLTGDNLEANAASIAEYLKLDATERPITSLPMYYSFGLSVINSHMKAGATILLTNDSIVIRPFWDFFDKYEATSFSGVPYTYEILRRFKFLEKPLPSLRTMTQAGGKLTPKFALEFAEFSRKKGVDFYIMYGQTEATARISYLPLKDNLLKHKSIGIAIPRGELSLIDSDGRPITKPGVDGELVYRGPNVMLGYAESEKDLVKGDELHGELKTGDIAQFDEDGYFYITGRMKRFIKIFGNRVNLDEIEHYLKSEGYGTVCGGKDDLLCVATTDSGKGEEIKIIIIRKYGFNHTTVKVIEVERIPKSSSGKVQYERVFAEIL
jgi:acyl-CoA synthetase (AMP-forming)/AMP-acid ligase II